MSDYFSENIEILPVENISAVLHNNGFNVKSLDRSADRIEIVEVTAEKLFDTVLFLKNHSDLKFDLLIYVAGIDTGESLIVIYHLYSLIYNKNLILKVWLNRSHPEIASISSIHSTANWHERETYDLLGIKFNGHPDLKRILLPDEWIGHPLRKDYKMDDARLAWNER